MYDVAPLLMTFLVSFAALMPFPIRAVEYTARALRPPSPHASVLFAGDMMFDRSIRTTIESRARNEGGLPTEALAKAGDFIFSCIDPLLAKHDLVVANLEGPITAYKSVSATSTPGDGNNYTFTFPPATAPLLHAHNIRVVNLGNNHMLNFGRVGYVSTKEYLSQAGVSFFGDVPGDSMIYHTAPNGVPLAFVGFNDFGGSASSTLAYIKEARARGDMPIVYTHWGEEYMPATDREKLLAHEFIDAGAEIVIGSHPHVVQEREIYHSKLIYYSLGNFIFDQYWNNDVSHGLMIEVILTTHGVRSVKEITVVLGRDRRTCAL